MHRPSPAFVFVLTLLAGAVPAVRAAEATGWTDTAEFSFVGTDGNAKSTSLGFKNTLGRKWDASAVTFRAGGIRVRTATFNRTATGGVVTETETEATTAESYFANGRYDRKITERLFWFGGAGWDRNEPAGIRNRYIAEAGVGHVWRDTDDVKFKTGYGVTFTDEEDTSGFGDNFAGARLSWDYANKFGANTTYTNVFTADLNLDETSDWRADMANGLAVAMSARLALKVGLQLLYDNQPAFVLVPDTLDPLTPVPFELDELDTILTVSLVVDFK